MAKQRIAMHIVRANEKPKPENLVRKFNQRFGLGDFGKYEVERAAGRLVSFLAYRGEGWKAFTLKGLLEYYDIREWPHEDILFGLLGPWVDESGILHPPDYIVHYGDCLAVTSLFLERIK